MLVSIFLLLAIALDIWLLLVKVRREPKVAPVPVFVESNARGRRK